MNVSVFCLTWFTWSIGQVFGSEVPDSTRLSGSLALQETACIWVLVVFGTFTLVMTVVRAYAMGNHDGIISATVDRTRSQKPASIEFSGNTANGFSATKVTVVTSGYGNPGLDSYPENHIYDLPEASQTYDNRSLATTKL